MNFRRFLKQLIKNAQSHETPNVFVTRKLLALGLMGNLSMACQVLRMKNAKAKGKHFTRLGKAALKANKMVGIVDIAITVQEGLDLRMILFHEMPWWVANLRDRQLDENKRLAVMLCRLTQGSCALEGQAVSGIETCKCVAETVNPLVKKYDIKVIKAAVDCACSVHKSSCLHKIDAKTV